MKLQKEEKCDEITFLLFNFFHHTIMLRNLIFFYFPDGNGKEILLTLLMDNL